ncbi:MAG: hypothetical protein WBL55_12615 [Xanthobacteraceae bacterium]
MGKTPDDGLVLARWDGAPRSPNNTTKDWTRTLADLKLPVVSLHALRHTHASQLIASGMDVLTISRRLGTAHRRSRLRPPLRQHRRSGGAVVEAAFGRALTE